MSARAKSLYVVLGLFAALMLRAPAVRADANSADDSDSLTVTVSPDVNYSLDITTTDAHMALGALALGQSTQTVRPATVTFSGSVLTGHELNLSAVITSPGTPWGFDATPSTGANTSAEADKLAMYALFSSTMLATAPTGTAFGDPVNWTTTPSYEAAILDGDTDSSVLSVRAGADNSDGTRFEYRESQGINAGGKNMDDNTAGSANAGNTKNGTAHLWFWLRLPSATTTGTAQSITVTLTHALGDL